MPSVEVEVRNAANTSGTTAVADTFNVGWQDRRNTIGVASFEVEDGTVVNYGDVLRGRVGNLRFPFRVEHKRPTLVSADEEGHESVVISGRHIVGEFDDEPIRDVPTLSNLAQTVPVLDDRVMGWMGPDFVDTDPGSGTWVPANIIAVQGWLSAFYTGLPSGWWDQTALWVGPHSGDHTNAPPGRNLFRRWCLIGQGKAVLDFAGDNEVQAYVNGRLVGSSQFKSLTRYEFEVTQAGWILVSFDLVNAPDDGPPGGNPTALLWTLAARVGDDYSVYAHSDANTYILEYPSTIPEVPIGRQMRAVLNDIPGLATDWTITGTMVADQNGTPYPPTGVMSYRLGADTPWQVYQQLLPHVDLYVDDTGRTLRPIVKNSVADPSGLTLTTGYSTAGQANPDLVNLVDLSWDLPETPFTGLVVRWARGRFLRGSGPRYKPLDLGDIEDYTAAVRIADGILAAASPQSASYQFVQPLDAAQWPGPSTWKLFDIQAVPGPWSHDSTADRVIDAITVRSTPEGEPIFTVDVGDPTPTRVSLLESASSRIASTLNGRAASASPAVRDSMVSAPVTATEWPMFGTGAWPIGTGAVSGVANPTRTGKLSSIRVTSTPGSGTTTLVVKRNGGTIATFVIAAGTTYSVIEMSLNVLVNDSFTLECSGDGGHQFVTMTGALTSMGE